MHVAVYQLGTLWILPQICSTVKLTIFESVVQMWAYHPTWSVHTTQLQNRFALDFFWGGGITCARMLPILILIKHNTCIWLIPMILANLIVCLNNCLLSRILALQGQGAVQNQTVWPIALYCTVRGNTIKQLPVCLWMHCEPIWWESKLGELGVFLCEKGIPTVGVGYVLIPLGQKCLLFMESPQGQSYIKSKSVASYYGYYWSYCVLKAGQEEVISKP